MAGGMNTKPGTGIPLAQRIHPKTPNSQTAAAQTAAVTSPIPGTLCSITGPAAGIVLAWQRDNTCRWCALVAAWIPAEQLTHTPTT